MKIYNAQLKYFLYAVRPDSNALQEYMPKIC